MATAVISTTKASFERYKKNTGEFCVHITKLKDLDAWKYFDKVVLSGDRAEICNVLHCATAKKLKP